MGCRVNPCFSRTKRAGEPQIVALHGASSPPEPARRSPRPARLPHVSRGGLCGRPASAARQQACQAAGRRRERRAGLHGPPRLLTGPSCAACFGRNADTALERLDGEKRRGNVVGTLPDEAAVTRLVGRLLLEQNEGWAIQRRHMTLETLALPGGDPALSLPAVTA